MNKTGKGHRGKLPNQQSAKDGPMLPPPSRVFSTLQAEYLGDYFHVSQFQVNRTSRIRNTKIIL